MKWTKPKANFNTDLQFGRLGELAFLHACEGSAEALDGKNGDVRILSNGKKAELKVDRYDHSKSENFFVERFSYSNKPGGVFRAMEDGSDFFVYYFENPGFLYIFRTVEFMTRVQELQKSHTLIDVLNTSHTTKGYKMKRELFKDLELTPEQIGIKFNSAKYQEFKTWNKASK